ncbi:MAG: hypothetical protein R2940_08965 [Syntrophotaleaceae bacterium]
MKRYRITLLVVCLVLLFLGYTDLNLLFRNPKPMPVQIAELEQGEPQQEWLTIKGGHQNLLEAISTSGSVEVNAFLVPLKTAPEAEDYRVLVETRNPQIVETLKTYYFKLESDRERQEFLEKNRQFFFGSREVTGMVMSGLIGKNNRNRLAKLSRDYGIDVPENVLLFTEGKTPAKLRGFFFVGIGLLGLGKLALNWRKKSGGGLKPLP